MTGQVTLDEVWRLFKATDDKISRLSDAADRRHAETEAAIARSRAEAEATMTRNRAEAEAAMARSRAEAEAAMARSRAEAEASRRETEASRRETEASQRKTDAALRELSRQMGRFSNQIGEFAEAMVVPAAKNIFLNRGIPVHVVARNLEGERDGKAIEVDILVVNNEHAVVVEVKNRPRVEHVTEHLERLAIFKTIFPIYRDYKIHGALAGITVDENVARYAYRRGLFVLGQNGETVSILNDDAFQPSVW